MAETAAREVYETGLRNAHAMEEQALSIMRPQIERLEHYPEMAARLERHVAETQAQIERLDKVMDAAGVDRSPLKDNFLSAVGGAAATGHAATSDEAVKNALANHAFENYEIAAYLSLITAARSVGDATALDLLDRTLREEREMAAWIADHIPQVTEAYIVMRSTGESAKR